MKLPDDEVLKAIAVAPAGFTTYIVDRIKRDRLADLLAGDHGVRIPSTRHVRNALDGLCSRGSVTRSSEPSGFYGYQWKLTDAGREALKGNHP